MRPGERVRLPHAPTAFAVALIGENVFQGLAITASTAVAFEAIGRSNPLASTTFCLVISAFNVPISYMLIVDGAGYSRHGISGIRLLRCLTQPRRFNRGGRRRSWNRRRQRAQHFRPFQRQILRLVFADFFFNAVGRQ